MIKVLKPGNTTKEVECQRCHALLSYHLNDVKSSTQVCFNYVINIKSIHCPECGRKIIISSRGYKI